MESCNTLKSNFFSSKNIQALQDRIRRTFKKESGHTIDRQNEQELMIIMGTVWAHNNPAPIDAMNKVVVDHVIPQIREGVKHHLNWQTSRDQPHLMERGQPGDKWNPLIIDDKIF